MNGKFKELKLEDFKGKVFHAKDDTFHVCWFVLTVLQHAKLYQ